MMKYAIVVVCVAALLVVAEIIRELHTFRVVHYRIQTPKLSKKTTGKKIVFLSDLHNCCYGKQNDKLIKAVREAHPELIFIVGDMLVGKAGASYRTAAEFVTSLPQICPVYYVNGNHEQRMREHPEKYGNAYFEYQKELKDAGVQFLINETQSLNWEGNSVAVTGLEIPETCYRHGKRAEMNLEEARERVGTATSAGYQILLVHQPDYMAVYKEWGADLILSGHLHGGIVRIPGLGGVISPQIGIFPKYSGDLYQEGDTSIVVSKGLGTHTVNIRLLNPAEIVVLHIEGQ